MTLYLFAVMSPIWSLYLVVCSLLSLMPSNAYPILEKPKIFIRVFFDSILNPFTLVFYGWFFNYMFMDRPTLNYFFNKIDNQLEIIPTSYFLAAVILYFSWYRLNHLVFKKIKPSFDFHKEYLLGFYSPSRLFGSAVILIVLLDFDDTILELLWGNIYLGIAIATVRYGLVLWHAYKTSSFLLTNR